MNVFNSIESFNSNKGQCLTIGTFDGVHTGHQKLLQILTNTAQDSKYESTILTFYPHPREIVLPNSKIELLTTMDEKIKIFETLNIDNLIIHKFTPQFANLLFDEFIENYLFKYINPQKIIIGYDHQFGKDRKGTIHGLTKYAHIYNFEITEVAAQCIDKIATSSTTVRNQLKQGDLKNITKHLGRYYCLQGIVVDGKQIGRKIGFPTANIGIFNTNKLLPKQGVYAVKVLVNKKKYNGMLNIGIKPTVNNNKDKTMEVNIFNFFEDIYNKPIEIEFVDYIRDEKKFDSLNELKLQLQNDKNEVLKRLLNV